MRFCVIFLCFFGVLHADEGEDLVILPAGQVIDGDYFAMGSNVEISGEIKGDLYVCGGQVVVDGRIAGDVLAVGAGVVISGEVGGNIRVLGGQVMLSGKVGRNVTLAAANGEVMAAATIAGNLVSIMGNGEIAGPIGRDAVVLASNIRLASKVGRNVDAYVGHLRITSRAAIGHDLEYTSSSQATIDPEAKIQGTTTHHMSVVRNFMKGQWIHGLLIGSKIAAVLMNFLYSIVIGWVLIRVFPHTLDAALGVLHQKPWRALAYGAIVLVILPLAFLLLLMTVLGAPFALTILALNIITFYTAKIIAIFWVANPLCKKMGMKQSQLGTLCLGLICYFLLTAIPFIGMLAAFSALLFGLGASVLGARRSYSKA